MSSQQAIPLGIAALAAGSLIATGGASAPVAGPGMAGLFGTMGAGAGAGAGAGILGTGITAGGLATGLSVAGTGAQIVGQLNQANAASAAGEYEKQEFDQAAGQTRAAGQLDAADTLRQGRYAQSRALALAAASGGGASAPGVTRLLSDIDAETRRRANIALYNANERATGMEMRGASANAIGRARRDQSRFGAVTSLLGGGTTLLERYG